MEAATALKPRLMFVETAGVIFAPRFGQDDVLDALCASIGFVVRSVPTGNQRLRIVLTKALFDYLIQLIVVQ
jgi:hypothetical protein